MNYKPHLCACAPHADRPARASTGRSPIVHPLRPPRPRHNPSADGFCENQPRVFDVLHAGRVSSSGGLRACLAPIRLSAVSVPLLH
ncbi:hypothetical protein B0H10DRAFT_39402 [Mycena sp. CBHHK59/15]|nr:hypothetical protein B0H10DRAFT_39402 [Mycena sp. CBHHK59/15]